MTLFQIGELLVGTPLVKHAFTLMGGKFGHLSIWKNGESGQPSSCESNESGELGRPSTCEGDESAESGRPLTCESDETSELGQPST